MRHDDQLPAPRLAERLRSAREETFVGRRAELESFREALAASAGSWAVLYAHGAGGIGKSALLRRFADQARAAGRPVYEIDGHTVDPDPAAFESEAAGALTDERPVLLVDGFDRCQGLEAWLRERFLPRLPGDALVVVASRRPPDPEWTSDPGWAGVLRVTALGRLEPRDATALLCVLGVGPALHESVLGYADGHPLALCLAAEVALRDRAWAAPSHDLIAALLSRLVGELPSAVHRHALEVCAHARTTTEDLLRAALPGEDTGSLFAWLRAQPYVGTGRHGVFPHEVVRDALDADLRWRDPRGYESMHRRMRVHLLERARAASGRALLPAVEAVKYLHRSGNVTPAFFTFSGDGEVSEDIFRPEDRPDLLALAARAEGEESAALVDFWLDRRPQDFRVHRRSDSGRPAAFMAWLRLTAPDEAELAADPVVAAVWKHCRGAGPLRGGEHLAVARFMVDPAAYQRPSAVMDLMLHRIVAEFLHQERLAWTYVTWTRATFWEPLMTYSDHHPVADPPVAGGSPRALYAHDWRVMPLADWLDFTGAEELFGPPAGSGAEERPAPFEVLSRPGFDAAVRDALRMWRRPDALAANPLIRGRLIAHSDPTDPAGPAETLREVLTDAVDALRDDPHRAVLHRVVAVTYFHGTPTQEAAAAQLGMAFSTYRRRLGRALEHISDRLWVLETG
ncbi:ATP-binding protein [Streptomyces sp. AK02-01A]|uniref:ATP-binding protein n=1 Tax=Streptomyces sp. AK02-01A TaxID=3028648 RepID=UPI0029A0FBBB|nr:ATP-binding protein [Streptomyces sp. AK02-01A]MDX3850128.1 ATP-binding protein [Streptomyces sp. AK02-01A]